MPGMKIFSCLLQHKENAFQAPAVLLKGPSARAEGLWKREGQRAGQSPSACPIHRRSIPAHPGGPGQVPALGEPPGLCLCPSHQEIISITQLTALGITRSSSLHSSQGPGFSFPLKKAPNTQPACEQASHAKATEQRQAKP